MTRQDALNQIGGAVEEYVDEFRKAMQGLTPAEVLFYTEAMLEITKRAAGMMREDFYQALRDRYVTPSDHDARERYGDEFPLEPAQ